MILEDFYNSNEGLLIFNERTVIIKEGGLTPVYHSMGETK